MSTSRHKPTRWIVAAAAGAGVLWAVLPLFSGGGGEPAIPRSGSEPWTPETTVGGAAAVETPPAPSPVPSPTPSGYQPPRVHAEGEEAGQPTLAAVPATTSTAALETLADAVTARLVAELTGAGRDRYPGVVWRNPPCCGWVMLTGLVADVTNPDLVRVITEWETDAGEGSGPTYWTTDPSGDWTLAAEMSP